MKKSKDLLYKLDQSKMPISNFGLFQSKKRNWPELELNKIHGGGIIQGF